MKTSPIFLIKNSVYRFFKAYYFDTKHEYRISDFVKIFVSYLVFFIISFAAFYFFGLRGYLGFWLKVFYIYYLTIILSLVCFQLLFFEKFSMKLVLLNLLDLVFTIFVASFFTAFYHILDFGTVMSKNFFFGMI